MKLTNKHRINPYKFSKTKYSTHGILFELINDLKEESEILDVGCNDGYLGKEFKKKYKFYGIDYMKETVNIAKKYYEGASYYDLNDLKQLTWNKKFDAIIFGDVLEHLVDAQSTLSFFVKNYLKDGGKVIISLPNVANFGIRIKLLFGIFNYTETGILDKTHLHLYTYPSARELIRNCDLKLISEYGGSGMLGFLIKKFPLLKGLLAHNIIILSEKSR